MNYRKQKSRKPARKMQGGTLLEVLVSILIFSCGMLAIVGLQAKSFKHSGDVQYRAEAIHLVNAYVGKMKAMAPPLPSPLPPPPAVVGARDTTFQALFNSATGAEFAAFSAELTVKLPGAGTPTVTFTPASASCAPGAIPDGSSCVEITVTWNPAGEEYAGGDTTHKYTQTSVIGNN